jgi:hypothetical protein
MGAALIHAERRKDGQTENGRKVNNNNNNNNNNNGNNNNNFLDKMKV